MSTALDKLEKQVIGGIAAMGRGEKAPVDVAPLLNRLKGLDLPAYEKQLPEYKTALDAYKKIKNV